MTPDLLYHSSPREENPDFGSGLERFGFWYIPQEVREWYDGIIGSLPQVLTTESLKEAPDLAIALLREIARYPLLEGMRIADSKDIVGQISLSGAKVGEVSSDSFDGGRTTDYMIPITTEQGAIEIVVNDAWGISWRLDEKHIVAVLCLSLPWFKNLILVSLLLPKRVGVGEDIYLLLFLQRQQAGELMFLDWQKI